VNTNKFNASVYFDPDALSLFGHFDVDIRMASALPYYKLDNNGKIVLTAEDILKARDNPFRAFRNHFAKNTGFAIDLGAVYRINEEIRVSASVTDLGFIRWKGSPLTMELKPHPDGKDVELLGFTSDQITNYINNGINFDTVFNIITDNFALKRLKAYNTMLTTKVMVNGYFDLTPSNRFIMQFKGFILGKVFMPQFTIAYNGTFFDVIDVVASYSIMKKSFENIGFALGLRMGPAHLYFGTENLLAFRDIKEITKLSGTVGLVLDFPWMLKYKEPELKSMFKNTKGKKVFKEPTKRIKTKTRKSTTNFDM
jgi:hypothetical protein